MPTQPDLFALLFKFQWNFDFRKFEIKYTYNLKVFYSNRQF